MWKLLRFLKGATTVVTTASALIAAAIVAVETYRALKKKVNEAKTP